MKRTVGLKILLGLFCLCLPLCAEIPCVWTGVERVVAVGDLHGDYANFVAILEGTKIVDKELHWAAGRTHLVQTGDILDRGKEAKAIFDLLINLEREAEAAGGHVHCLIGNHEEINMMGIAFSYPDYVTVEQFKDFLPDDYRHQREIKFRQRWLAQNPSLAHDSSALSEAVDAFWADVRGSDKDAQALYFDFFRQHYGQWIAQHNAVIKINETVFVHGGINEKYSLLPLAEINDRLRSELQNILAGREFERKIIFYPDSPLWYRELAQPRQNEAIFEEEVDLILANLKARHLVIGHTYLNSPSARAMKRFGGKVWVVDTGISAVYGGHLSALIIEGDNFQTWGVNNGQN
ncbi:MAG: metallophosphoesterase [Candidatus Aminicenantales bacterium]